MNLKKSIIVNVSKFKLIKLSNDYIIMSFVYNRDQSKQTEGRIISVNVFQSNSNLYKLECEPITRTAPEIRSGWLV